MAKELFIVSIEGDCARAVRMRDTGTAVIQDRAEWTRRTSGNGERGTGNGEESSNPGDDAAEEETYCDFLERAFNGVAKKFGAHEIILGVGLDRVLSSELRLPLDDADLLGEKAAEALAAQSPFPDDPLEVGLEQTSQTPTSVRSLAFALPDKAAADITAALDAASLRVVRTDANILGWVHTLELAQPPPPDASSNVELALLNLSGIWNIALFEDGKLAAVRSLGAVSAAALKRELMLTLVRNAPRGVFRTRVFTSSPLEADFAGALLFLGASEEPLGDPFGGVIGLGRLAAASPEANFTPAIWLDALRETRFTKRLRAVLAVAGAVWLAALAVIMGVPKYYDWRTAQIKALSKAHAVEYKAVSDTKERALLVRRYSNRDTSALELLRLVSEIMPQDVNLSKFQYVKDDKLVLSGDAGTAQPVYEFVNRLRALNYTPAGEDGEEAVPVPMFPDEKEGVVLKGPTARRGKQQFTIEASLKTKEAEE